MLVDLCPLLCDLQELVPLFLCGERDILQVIMGERPSAAWADEGWKLGKAIIAEDVLTFQAEPQTVS